jgi:hypothetical protein
VERRGGAWRQYGFAFFLGCLDPVAVILIAWSARLCPLSG